MRSTVVYWSLGFLSVSLLGGCCGLRDHHCEQCGAPVENSGFLPSQVRLLPRRGSEPPRTFAGVASPTIPGATTNEPPRNLDGGTVVVKHKADLPFLRQEVRDLPVSTRENVIEVAPFKVDGTPPVQSRDSTARHISHAEAARAVPHASGKSKDHAIAIKEVHTRDGHAEKFATVTGEVQVFRNTLRVRYAAVTQEDPYGGFVILDGGAELNRLRDGQQVRVRGVLVPPIQRGAPAHYRVRSVEILD